MQPSKIIFFLTVFISTIILAEVQKGAWKIKVHTVKALDTLKIFESDSKSQTPVLIYNAKSTSTGFKGAEEIYFPSFKRSVIVTRWSHGAHSETMRIFDPKDKSKPLQFELLSTWPADVQLKDDRLLISIPEEKYDGDPEPVSVSTEWAPDFVTKAPRQKEIKASNPDISQVPQNP